MMLKVNHIATIADRVDSALILNGFDLARVCPVLSINYNTAYKALRGERKGLESRRVIRRLASFFEQNSEQELSVDLLAMLREWESEAA